MYLWTITIPIFYDTDIVEQNKESKESKESEELLVCDDLVKYMVEYLPFYELNLCQFVNKRWNALFSYKKSKLNEIVWFKSLNNCFQNYPLYKSHNLVVTPCIYDIQKFRENNYRFIKMLIMFVDQINAKNDKMAYKIIKIFAELNIAIAVRWCLYYTFQVNEINFSLKHWRDRNENKFHVLFLQISRSHNQSYLEMRCIIDWIWKQRMICSK